MAHRIENTSIVEDTRAQVKLRRFITFGWKVTSVLIADVYTTDKKLSQPQLVTTAKLLTNPITQKYGINKSVITDGFDFAIEVGFLPGVTDNIANTAREMIEDRLKVTFSNNEGLYNSQITFIKGTISEKDAQTIASSLFNPLIQRAVIKSYRQYTKDKGMDVVVPKVHLQQSATISLVNLNVDDTELSRIGKEGIANKDGTRRGPLALNLEYMKAIQKYFVKKNRQATDVELETLAQTWSEHCKHTIFANPLDDIVKGLYKTYIKGATEHIRKQAGQKDFCVSVFHDNSGAITFDKEYLITHKVETHNSPSALDPFGGAITGIVGVNRDAIGFGLGSKPIANMYGFCFANPQDTMPLYKGQNFTQAMLLPKRIMEGVIEGVNVGGNCSGIPTPQGFVYFHDRYKGKPLVFVGTIGLIPKTKNGKKLYIKKAKAGDYIVMVGGRVGKDGIHGATFSSEALNTGSPATAVQIGDPITQKKLSDAIVKEARDLNLFNSITDNGAGGLSSSVGEMAKESNGCLVILDKVPLKYPGLAPWEIWISESQERMTLSVPKNKWKKFYDLMKKRGVEATIIGTFTKTGKCVVEYKNKTILNLDMKFLHDGLPTLYQHSEKPEIVSAQKLPLRTNDLSSTLLKMLQRQNITSYSFISQQYDHEVQANSVLKPLQGKGRVNSETTVIKPLLNSSKGVITSQGLYPTYAEFHPYDMAACTIDTSIRNLVASGANPDYIALLDNFCWCSSTEAQRLWQLKEAAKACYDYATAYKTPFIAGKDSMFNDFKGFDHQGKPVKISVPPTLLMSAIGVIDNVINTVSLDLKSPGDLIYLLGDTHDELQASEYFQMTRSIGTSIPKVNAKKNRQLYRTVYNAIQNELITAALSVTRGGLAVALAKMAIAGKLGIEISLQNILAKTTRDDFTLFSESQGRIIITINPANKKSFEKLMKNLPLQLLGTVKDNQQLIIKNKSKKKIVDMTVNKALQAYRSTFKNY